MKEPASLKRSMFAAFFPLLFLSWFTFASSRIFIAWAENALTSSAALFEAAVPWSGLQVWIASTSFASLAAPNPFMRT